MNWPKQRTGILLSSNLVWGSLSCSIEPNSLRALPFFLPGKARLDLIGVSVKQGGGAGAKIRMGIYTDDGNRYPDKLIVDGGDLDATQSDTDRLVLVDQVLESGVYWLVTETNDPLIQSWRPCDGIWLLGRDREVAIGWVREMSYGVLPATYLPNARKDCLIPHGFYRIAEYLEE